MLYLSASPPLGHSGADHELLKTKSGATGLALSSFGFGKKRPQRNATLKGKSQLQIHNNTLDGTDKQVRKDSHFLFSIPVLWLFKFCVCLFVSLLIQSRGFVDVSEVICGYLVRELGHAPRNDGHNDH